jgi:superfamily II DNA/RNA helicase
MLFYILLQALELFRKQEVDFLIATDVAARVSDFCTSHIVIYLLLR